METKYKIGLAIIAFLILVTIIVAISTNRVVDRSNPNVQKSKTINTKISEQQAQNQQQNINQLNTTGTIYDVEYLSNIITGFLPLMLIAIIVLPFINLLLKRKNLV